jgi:D-arginine dehydrogenase
MTSLKTADFLIVGGGIAGASAAARLALHGHTIMLEAESAFGYHSSGRSATQYHFGIGNAAVRGLTAFSREYLEQPTENGVDLSRSSPAMFIATPQMLENLETLISDMSPFTDQLERLEANAIRAIVPSLKCGSDGIVRGVIDRSARRLDSELMLQDYRAQLKRHGGQAIINARAVSITKDHFAWTVTTASGERFSAPVLVNAAGAWCDDIARLAGVAPLGLQPLRRTIIVFEAPEGQDTRSWPFTKTVVDDFYMLPESGKLLACPVDEVPSEPTDAQPDEYGIALAAAKVEQYTSMSLRRIGHSWAGLRTFTRDRVPVAGFDTNADGFFWLAGQGGYGLQTAPAMSYITESLISGRPWPQTLFDLGISEKVMGLERLRALYK